MCASEVHGASAWTTLQAAIDVCFGRLAQQRTGHLAGRRACICVGGFCQMGRVAADAFRGVTCDMFFLFLRREGEVEELFSCFLGKIHF